jgi:hypothetical protein
MSPLLTISDYLKSLAGWLNAISQTAIYIGLAIALTLLLLRFLTDKLNFNPFSRFAYYARRPTEKWFYEIKGSQFYRPIRQALGFDPAYLLLLLAFVILFYLLNSLISFLVALLSFLSITLNAFGVGETVLGGRYLLGTVLLALLYFLMALMTILVIHSWFGLFDRPAHWAGRRIYPLLYSIDPSGKLGPFLFIILFLLLSFVAGAVQSIFF